MSDLTVAPAKPRDALHLLEAHHALMLSLFSRDACHFLDVDALEAPHIRFFAAKAQGAMVGCGALSVQDGYGEIKSMFTAPEARGKGVADAVLSRLETEARALSLPHLLLETGDTLDAAHRLYARHGFAFRGPFADYTEHPSSRFMEKRLS